MGSRPSDRSSKPRRPFNRALRHPRKYWAVTGPKTSGANCECRNDIIIAHRMPPVGGLQLVKYRGYVVSSRAIDH